MSLRMGAGDFSNSEKWLTKSLSTENLWFTSTGAVKELRGGFPSGPQKGFRAYDNYHYK
jgi:hypothetical protein